MYGIVFDSKSTHKRYAEDTTSETIVIATKKKCFRCIFNKLVVVFVAVVVATCGILLPNAVKCNKSREKKL